MTTTTEGRVQIAVDYPVGTFYPVLDGRTTINYTLDRDHRHLWSDEEMQDHADGLTEFHATVEAWCLRRDGMTVIAIPLVETGFNTECDTPIYGHLPRHWIVNHDSDDGPQLNVAFPQAEPCGGGIIAGDDVCYFATRTPHAS